MEPDFKNVEKAFNEVENASVLHFSYVDYVKDEEFVTCDRCKSTINTKVLSSNIDMEGVCILCAKDTDLQPHIETPKYDYTYVDTRRYGGEEQQEHQNQYNTRLRAEYDTKTERLNSMLRKIGKRDVVQKSAKKHLFNSLRYRPLFKQPQHSDAVAKFRAEVAKLLPRRDEVEKKQPKDGVKYVLVVSWCSSHDEWQENSDMDEY